MGRDVGKWTWPTGPGKEVDMVKALGAALDTNESAAKERVRRALELELNVSPLRPRRRSTAKLLLVAATLAAASLGGIAIAQDDGAGVDAPAAEKVPFVRQTLDELEHELAALDTSTKEGAAKAESLNVKIEAVRGVLTDLCAEAADAVGC
jgi:hypothetical protein